MPSDLDFGEFGDDTSAGAAVNPGEDAALTGLRSAIAWAWESGQSRLLPLLQQRLECELLRHALAQPDVSQVQLARRLGMARNTLRARLKQYGLEEPADNC
jgi:DNA-binding NtrC family response regulator